MADNRQEIIINHYSENEVDDLIGSPPSWLLRSGISMIGLIFLAILSITFFIKYPDKIEGSGILTSENPPIELIGRANGYIDTILVKANHYVKFGDVILYIKNTTNPKHINQLNDWMNHYSKIQEPQHHLSLSFPENLQLGVLQNEYAELSLRFSALKQTLKNNMAVQKAYNLSNEIEELKKLIASQKKVKNIYSEELDLSEKGYQRSISLFSDSIISKLDLEKSQAAFLQRKRQFETLENSLIQNNIRIKRLSFERLKLQDDRLITIKNQQLVIAEIILKLKSKIEIWFDTYTITAPISGIVTFNSFITQNRTIEAERIIGYIIPREINRKYLSCTLPVTNIGKVESGQKTVLKFDAYPYKEYGTVISEVSSISFLPEVKQDNKRYYEIKISLPDTIVTDYGMEIPYKPNMTSKIEIITEDKSVLNRIFEQFIALIKNQSS